MEQERKVERMKFRKSLFTHLPCATYGDDTRAIFTLGGSDAVMSEWTHCCRECAVSLVLSAFEIPELARALIPAIRARLEQFSNEPCSDSSNKTPPVTPPKISVHCPYCDFVATTAFGLGGHVRAKHKDKLFEGVDVTPHDN